jgi:hypothetical protein
MTAQQFECPGLWTVTGFDARKKAAAVVIEGFFRSGQFARLIIALFSIYGSEKEFTVRSIHHDPIL